MSQNFLDQFYDRFGIFLSDSSQCLFNILLTESSWTRKIRHENSIAELQKRISEASQGWHWRAMGSSMKIHKQWSFLNPISILLIYIFFSSIDKDSWNGFLDILYNKILSMRWINENNIISLTIEKGVIVIGGNNSSDQSVLIDIRNRKITIFILLG